MILKKRKTESKQKRNKNLSEKNNLTLQKRQQVCRKQIGMLCFVCWKIGDFGLISILSYQPERETQLLSEFSSSVQSYIVFSPLAETVFLCSRSNDRHLRVVVYKLTCSCLGITFVYGKNSLYMYLGSR